MLDTYKFKNLLVNNTEGSLGVLVKFLDLVVKTKPSEEEFEVAMVKIKQAFPDMAILENSLTLDLANPVKAKELMEELNDQNTKIFDNLSKQVPSNSTVLTFSNSSTIVGVLNQYQNLDVVSMISHPGGEGRNMKRSLRHDVQLVSDREGVYKIAQNQVDAVIMSCDAYYPEEGFINKKGSKHIIETADKNNISVFILCSSRKKITGEVKKVHSDLFEFVPFKPNVKLVMNA